MSRVRIRDTLRFSAFCGNDDVDPDYIPDDNAEYKSKMYWEWRFRREPTWEWLGTFHDTKIGMESTGVDFSAENKSVLVVGCGNSMFSKDLALQCPTWNILSIDFSENVINAMMKRFPQLAWKVEDMTTLASLQDGIFDYVFDKAAMDALVADEGNPWDPSESSKTSILNMLKSCGRVLKPGGKMSIISFQPIHFRRAHLKRAMELSAAERVSKWNSDISIKNCENANLGTEFAVFTLTKSNE